VYFVDVLPFLTKEQLDKLKAVTGISLNFK